MIVEILGKFYDNHSLSIVNRNLALSLDALGLNIRIIPIDSYDPEFAVNKKIVAKLKKLEKALTEPADIQIRHTYPPIWAWPEHKKTKIVYIQPWEFSKAPFEWQYKFETFADALIVPSDFCRSVFLKGGINPSDIYTIPNGYDDTVYNNKAAEPYKNITDDKFNFVYVGNAQWRKGLEILLNTWSQAFRKYDKARLIIKDNPFVYGKNNVLNEIIKLQYLTDCAEIIYIDDNLSDEELASIYKKSKVIVHPYRAEGFGMHVQEAMACGCYPIVSANGPTDEFVPNLPNTKIQTKTELINITDPKIFASKHGDAMTQMGSHTFVNEPVPSSLLHNMLSVYSNHKQNDLYKALMDNLTIKNWEQVAQLLKPVLVEIHNKPIKRKG
jgi:glycosyltransferase involved in cell wall biosynthesis